MGRKPQKPEESVKRALILKTAKTLFVTEGYDDVSMDALAEAVPVSKRTLYNHFEDKKALFAAVMQTRCESIASMIEEILRDDRDVKVTLTDFGRQFLSIVLDPQAVHLYRTAITQSQKFPAFGKMLYEAGPKRSRDTLIRYLTKLHERGVLHISDPTLAAEAFLSMLAGRKHMRLLLGVTKKATQKEIDDNVHYVVDMFLRSHQPRR